MLLDHLTPGAGIGDYYIEYYELGRADTRYVLVSDGRGICLYCQRRQGKRAWQVWKQRVTKLGPVDRPHGGTMNRMIFNQGWKVKGKPGRGVEASLNKTTPCVGYEVSVPGSNVHTWVMLGSGKKVVDAGYQYDRYGSTDTMLISLGERKLLNWK